MDEMGNKFGPFAILVAMRGNNWITNDEYHTTAAIMHLLMVGDYNKKNNDRGCTFSTFWGSWYNELRKGCSGPLPVGANAAAQFTELVRTNVPLALAQTLDLTKEMEKAKNEMRSEMDRYKEQLKKDFYKEFKTDAAGPPRKKQKSEEELVCEKWVLQGRTKNVCTGCRSLHKIDEGLLDYLPGERGKKWNLTDEEKKEVLSRN